MSRGIRKWLGAFGLDKKYRFPLSIPDSKHKASEIANEVIDKVNDLLLEFKDEERIDFLEELYYNLGAIMHGLIQEKMSLEGIKEEEGEPTFYRELLKELPKGSLRIFDHQRYYGGDELIYHPYDGTMEEFEKLINICKKLGLTFTVSGISEYFPGHAFKIVIKKMSENSKTIR